jgi:hypothetical protein
MTNPHTNVQGEERENQTDPNKGFVAQNEESGQQQDILSVFCSVIHWNEEGIAEMPLI